MSWISLIAGELRKREKKIVLNFESVLCIGNVNVYRYILYDISLIEKTLLKNKKFDLECKYVKQKQNQRK